MAYIQQDTPADADFGGYSGAHDPSIVGVGCIVFFVFVIWKAYNTLNRRGAFNLERNNAETAIELAWIGAALILVVSAVWWSEKMIYWLIT